MVSGEGNVAARLRVAQEALEEANRRREVAREAVVEFALRAIVEGRDLEEVMDACGFVEAQEAAPVLAQLLGGHACGTRRQRFAQWIGQELASRIAREPDREAQP